MSKYVLNKARGLTAQVILTNTEAGASRMLGPASAHIDEFFLYDIIGGVDKAQLTAALKEEWCDKEIEEDVAKELMGSPRTVSTTASAPKKKVEDTKDKPGMSEELASAMTVLEEVLDKHEEPTKVETAFNCDDILADLGIEL